MTKKKILEKLKLEKMQAQIELHKAKHEGDRRMIAGVIKGLEIAIDLFDEKEEGK